MFLCLGLILLAREPPLRKPPPLRLGDRNNDVEQQLVQEAITGEQSNDLQEEENENAEDQSSSSSGGSPLPERDKELAPTITP